MTFHHPETGELLEDEEALRAALSEVEERMAPLYRTRRVLREALCELAGPAVLPRRRQRTDTQQRVAQCPRCGQTYSEEREEGRT